MDDYTGKLPPLMEDLMNVLNGMQGGEQIALKLSKYVTGTFGKLFNNYTNRTVYYIFFTATVLI